MCYASKYEVFEQWNHHLIKHVFPELVSFTWALTDLEEVPEYPVPDRVTVQRALAVLLDKMVDNREAFEARYNEVATSEKIVPPVGWNLAALLMSFFK
jgi:hypothetical protein